MLLLLLLWLSLLLLLLLLLLLFTALLGVHADPESDVSGIPDFWMHVLQSHKGWSEEVSPLLAAPPASQSVSQGCCIHWGQLGYLIRLHSVQNPRQTQHEIDKCNCHLSMWADRPLSPCPCSLSCHTVNMPAIPSTILVLHDIGMTAWFAFISFKRIRWTLPVCFHDHSKDQVHFASAVYSIGRVHAAHSAYCLVPVCFQGKNATKRTTA